MEEHGNRVERGNRNSLQNDERKKVIPQERIFLDLILYFWIVFGFFLFDKLVLSIRVLIKCFKMKINLKIIFT